MKLACAMLLLVGVTHYGYELIAMGYGNPAAAAKAWFYMLRGVEGVGLFAIVAALARSRAVMAVCLLGMSEEGMTTACRASKPIGEVPGYAPLTGLCGQEWFTSGLIALGFVAFGVAYEIGNHRGKTRS